MEDTFDFPCLHPNPQEWFSFSHSEECEEIPSFTQEIPKEIYLEKHAERRAPRINFAPQVYRRLAEWRSLSNYLITEDTLECSFREQVDKWKAETRHWSSILKMIAHPSYLRIIGLSAQSTDHKIERLLLKELQEDPDYWFDALTAITGENPVQMEHDFDEAVTAWLEWGRQRGLI
jgi:hypothetical protein